MVVWVKKVCSLIFNFRAHIVPIFTEKVGKSPGNNKINYGPLFWIKYIWYSIHSWIWKLWRTKSGSVWA